MYKIGLSVPAKKLAEKSIPEIIYFSVKRNVKP